MPEPRVRAPQQRHEPRRPRFRDRADAGHALADRLTAYRGRPGTVVLGLSAAGMPAAAAVARTLDLPLDILITSRLRAPGRRRIAMGAIAEDGDPHLNPAVLWGTGATREYILAEVARQAAVLAEGRRRLRAGRSLALPPQATAILVADGLTSGTMAMAAIRALRARGVARLVLAAPVAPPETVDRVSDAVDELVVLETPLALRTASEAYDDFPPVSAADVRRLLTTVGAPKTGGTER